MTHPYVEAVARAICCGGDGKCFRDDNETLKGLPCGWEGRVMDAKNALTTLAGMEPTEGMVEAGHIAVDQTCHEGNCDILPASVCRAMLSQLAKEIGE